MKRLMLLLICMCILSFSLWGQDTILFRINVTQYEDVAQEKLNNELQNPNSLLFKGCKIINQLKTFSVPIMEWNQKAIEYSCENPYKLEDLLLFQENPYFQLILFVNTKQQVVGSSETTISEIRKQRRERDSIEWISDLPSIPFTYWSDRPLSLYSSLKDLTNIYQYSQKNPDSFIFMIANFEGFFIIKDSVLYKLEGNTIKDANQYFYLYSDEYIRDIANRGRMRIGYNYIGCMNAKEAKLKSKQKNNVFIKVTRSPSLQTRGSL